MEILCLKCDFVGKQNSNRVKHNSVLVFWYNDKALAASGTFSRSWIIIWVYPDWTQPCLQWICCPKCVHLGKGAFCIFFSLVIYWWLVEPCGYFEELWKPEITSCGLAFLITNRNKQTKQMSSRVVIKQRQSYADIQHWCSFHLKQDLWRGIRVQSSSTCENNCMYL